MSFSNCIDAKIAGGDERLKEQGEKIKRNYEKFRDYHRRSHDDATAEGMAAADALNKAQGEAAYEALIKQRSALDWNRYNKTVKNKASGQHWKAVRYLSEQSINRSQAIHRNTLAGLQDYVETNRSKLAGLMRDTSNARAVVRELLGEATGDAEANTYAQALRTSMNNLKQRYRNAGGIVDEMDNYHPQSHSRELLNKVSREEWKAEILPLLDRKRMKDFETGLPIDDVKLNEILDDTYEVTTTGVSRDMKKVAEEGGQLPPFGGDVNLRHRHKRILHFKDSESFLKYNDKFGSNKDNLYDMMLGHLEEMARDIALLETFGVRPHQLMRKAEQQMAVQNASNKNQFTGAKTNLALASYKIASGQHLNKVDEHWSFNALGHVQSLLRAAYLGGAVISSITDLPHLYTTARHHGLRPAKVIGNHFKGINPASSTQRRIAKRLGYMADIAASSAIGQTRMATDSLAAGLPQALSNFTIVASGLRAWTNSVKDAVSMEFEGLLAEHSISNTAFNNLPKNLRITLEEGGITSDDWVLMKKAPLFEPEEGATFLNSFALESLNSSDPVYIRELGAKLDTITEGMRRMATNEPTVDVMAITTGFGAAKGTFTRAAASSFLMLKTFPLTMMQRQLFPLLGIGSQNLRVNKAEHFAAAVVSTTLLGALALQAKELTKGKTPEDTNKPEFWLASMLQGGGLGLFGDFLFQDYSRFGQSPLESMAGPVAVLPFDAIRAAKGNIDRAITGGDGETLRDTGRDTYKFLVDKIPAKNLWYSKLVFDRMIFDKMEQLIDPEFNRRVRRSEKVMRKKTGQEYWWKTGESLPEGM